MYVCPNDNSIRDNYIIINFYRQLISLHDKSSPKMGMTGQMAIELCTRVNVRSGKMAVGHLEDPVWKW